MMAELRGAGPAIGPVPAGMVSAVGISPAIRLRAGEHIVLIGRVAGPLNRVAFFGERRGLIDVIAETGNLHRVSMQIRQALRDAGALGAIPGSLANAIAGVDGRLAAGCAGAEIGVPGSVAGSRGCGQGLGVAG